MKKIGKVSLVLLVLSMLLLGSVPTTVLGQRYRSDYENASQKVFAEIKSFSFVFDSTTLNYSIIFGAMFIKLNDTHSKLVADVFVITLGDDYVYPLTANLEFNASFSYDGTWNNHSGVGVDSTDLIEFSDLLYNYTIHSFLITNDLFPLNLYITFEWDLTSQDTPPPYFSESGTYNVMKNFVMTSTDDGIPGYFIPIAISILVGGVLVFIIFNKKKKITRID